MKNIIRCPHCKQDIDVEKAIFDSIKNQFDQDFISKSNEMEEKFRNKEASLKAQEDALKNSLKEQERLIEDKVKIREAQIQKDLSVKFDKDYEKRINDLVDELNNKSEKIKEIQEKELELIKQKRQIEEKEKAVVGYRGLFFRSRVELVFYPGDRQVFAGVQQFNPY